MSNLIEQLGGYEQANSKLLKMDKILKEVYYSHSDAQKANELRQALLEHRRQHSIFEVGDKVVFDAHFCDEHKGSGYGEITYCTMDKRVFEIDNYYLVSIDEIRHATDAEIKAGHRLPQLEVLNDTDIPPNTIILGDK